jgi:hypothetical protein
MNFSCLNHFAKERSEAPFGRRSRGRASCSDRVADDLISQRGCAAGSADRYLATGANSRSLSNAHIKFLEQPERIDAAPLVITKHVQIELEGQRLQDATCFSGGQIGLIRELLAGDA